MAESTTDERRGGAPRGWIAKLSWSRLWRLVTLAVLALTALFGGLATVDKHASVAEVGKPFSNGQFTIVVERASTVSQGTGGTRQVLPAKPGVRYLGVVATIRNDGTTPGTLQGQLRLQNVPDAEELLARRMSDSQPVSSIGPGLTENVVFLWSLPETAVKPGDSVTVDIWKKEFRELISSYGKSWVAASADYIRIEIPVQYRP